MRLRAGLLGASALVAVLSMVSLTQASGGASSPKPATQPTAKVSAVHVHTNTARRRASRRATRHPHASIPPATVMTSPSQAAAPASSGGTSGVSLARMVGQQLMVRMSGTVPDPNLLHRIRAGQVGGVIIYTDNVQSQTQLNALTGELQQAARAGGNPPLLVSTDQEGGEVKRLPWAPPTQAPPQMAADGAAAVEQQGQGTGEALAAAGINVDLAPVADVAHSSSAFIWQQQRSFSMSPTTVTDDTVAFSDGLQAAGVAATAKHFPGLGSAAQDTDYTLEHLTLAAEDLTPYHALIAKGIPLIMISTAIYTNFDRTTTAATSRSIITGLLRDRMGYSGVVITDDLQTPSEQSTDQAAVAAARAGADIILVSTTESAGPPAYDALLAAAQSGQMPRSQITASYQRIMALKQRYASA